MIGITILGATGSIGLNALDIIAKRPEQFQVFALTAHTNVDTLYRECLRFYPRYAVMQDVTAAEQLQKRLRAVTDKIEVLAGSAALEMVASHNDTHYVVAAIVGAAGLLPTLAAVKTGKRVLLANKEALVMAGKLFMQAVHAHQAQLLPIDSEHNAIFQCLPVNFADEKQHKGIRRLILTASGGPFRNTPLAELAKVTPQQACAHPNWSMGRKVSVDSATMMNKGLEVIEAHWLFDMSLDKIEVLMHPQSIIHSLVEYVDGSVMAQLGNPDMRTPIAHALAWPERIPAGVNSLDLAAIGRLDFEPVSLSRFPCLSLAYQTIKIGGTATVNLNAANEVAVQAFLDGRLTFDKIPYIIESVLTMLPTQATSDLESIFKADHEARECAKDLIK